MYHLDRVDPVGAFFYEGARGQNVSRSVSIHAGWGNTTLEGPNQYFAISGVCATEMDSLADDQAWNDRHHIRIGGTASQAHSYDNVYGWWQIGSPHFEIVVNCNGDRKHGVRAPINGASGFDTARARLANTISHSNYAVYYGNTQTFPQGCPGNQWGAASQGYIRHISQHDWLD